MQLKTLKQLAVIGGLTSLGGAAVITAKIQANFRRQAYYQKTMELTQGYPAVQALLGKPIRPLSLELFSTKENFTDGYQARIAIPLKGSKTHGKVHSWSSRQGPESSWEVQKLDMELDDKQWTFYINPAARHLIKPTENNQAHNVFETLNSNKERSSESDGSGSEKNTHSTNSQIDTSKNSSVKSQLTYLQVKK